MCFVSVSFVCCIFCHYLYCIVVFVFLFLLFLKKNSFSFFVITYVYFFAFYFFPPLLMVYCCFCGCCGGLIRQHFGFKKLNCNKFTLHMARNFEL
jgi:hypothetical protein